MQNTDREIINSSKIEPALYITTTPIGNYGDITLRAIETLNNVDIIACEDTRVTAKLLNKLEIKKSLMVYNDHSSQNERLKLIKKIKEGASIALVSDAGTPLISNPGYKLIQDCMKNDIKIIAIPGVSSVITALSISGLPTDRFMFNGFFQPKSSGRKKQLEEIKYLKATMVFFETSRRLLDALNDIRDVFGERQVSVARELTKIYEEIKTDLVSDVIKYYKSNPPKGEIVLMIEGWTKETKSSLQNDFKKEIELFLKENIKNLKPKKLAKELGLKYGLDSKKAYQMILEYRNK